MNRAGKIHALLATARIANVPSVVSNIWVGVVLGWMLTDREAQALPLAVMSKLFIAGICLYVSGNFLNDWADQKWDAIQRPERALPRGLFPSRLYLVLALLFTGSGVAAAVSINEACALVSGSIAILIVIYTVMHKKTAWGVIPMAGCRAMLPVMGCVAFFPYIDRIWPASLALFVYIAGLSLTARQESKAEPSAVAAALARALLLAAAVAMTWFDKSLAVPQRFVIAGALPYLAWTAFCLRWWRRPVPRLVSGLLAGIPLVDWMALLPIGLAMGTSAPISPLSIACIAVPPVAFAAALLLQRLAPAT